MIVGMSVRCLIWRRRIGMRVAEFNLEMSRSYLKRNCLLIPSRRSSSAIVGVLVTFYIRYCASLVCGSVQWSCAVVMVLLDKLRLSKRWPSVFISRRSRFRISNTEGFFLRCVSCKQNSLCWICLILRVFLRSVVW